MGHDKGQKSCNGRLEMLSHSVCGTNSSSHLLPPFLAIFPACAEPRQMQHVKGQNTESAQTQADHVVGSFQAAVSAVTRRCVCTIQSQSDNCNNAVAAAALSYLDPCHCWLPFPHRCRCRSPSDVLSSLLSDETPDSCAQLVSQMISRNSKFTSSVADQYK